MASFGVVIPGRPIFTDFTPFSADKAGVVIPEPQSISEIVFFLLPSSPVPIEHGAVLYFSTDQTHWELLGNVSHAKPSGVFRTGWSTREELTGCPLIYLAVSLESLGAVQNIDEKLSSGVEDRFNFAHKIALDLFQFMASFSQSSQPGSMLVPTNIFDKWMERFERKYRLDPNFMMKKSP